MTSSDNVRAQFARRVYQMLCMERGLRPEEITRSLGATREQMQDAMDWLGEHGLVDWAAVTPVVAPQSALRDLFAGQQERIEELTRTNGLIADLTAGFLTMPSLVRRERLELEIFEDSALLHQRLAELRSLNKKEVSVMLPSLVSRECLHVSMSEDLDLIDRGIRYRLLLHASALGTSGSIEYANALQESGAEVRIAESLPLRLIILDQEKVVTRLHIETLRRDVLIDGGLLTQVFLSIFEHSWSIAAPYTPEHSRRSSTSRLTATHHCILRMMAGGATDKAIARHLGYSDRTIRRLVAEILRILGTDNRFTAMVKASRLGLLERDAVIS